MRLCAGMHRDGCLGFQVLIGFTLLPCTPPNTRHTPRIRPLQEDPPHTLAHTRSPVVPAPVGQHDGGPANAEEDVGQMHGLIVSPVPIGGGRAGQDVGQMHGLIVAPVPIGGGTGGGHRLSVELLLGPTHSCCRL